MNTFSVMAIKYAFLAESQGRRYRGGGGGGVWGGVTPPIIQSWSKWK